MTTIEDQITELGMWAAGLELSAADPTAPYWMRRQDAERAERIRQTQAELIDEIRREQEQQMRRYPDDFLQAGFHKCSTEGCNAMIIGGDFCARCEEEINGTPYPFANILLGATFVQYVTRIWKRICHA